ncbi:MAG: imidazole glycerol phosphate synthase subunit HisH [Gemmatimonadaceae bacterium]|nr:imidazole glycerol phosphate synthase subunit HisH [Gemmatimonadaceae bacterium]
MIIAVFDYGAGNLHSLLKTLSTEGEVTVVRDPLTLLASDLIVLPGVGGWSAGVAALGSAGPQLRAAIRAGHPTLGICLGMQLLFDQSEEAPGAGLGVIAGTVTRLHARRVPEIGWNSVESVRDPLFDEGPSIVYYAHSFACRPASEAPVIAWTTHERDRFAAAVRMENTIGVQFHPEKSSQAGVALLRRAVRTLLPQPARA